MYDVPNTKSNDPSAALPDAVIVKIVQHTNLQRSNKGARIMQIAAIIALLFTLLVFVFCSFIVLDAQK